MVILAVVTLSRTKLQERRRPMAQADQRPGDGRLGRDPASSTQVAYVMVRMRPLTSSQGCPVTTVVHGGFLFFNHLFHTVSIRPESVALTAIHQERPHEKLRRILPPLLDSRSTGGTCFVLFAYDIARSVDLNKAERRITGDHGTEPSQAQTAGLRPISDYTRQRRSVFTS